MKNVVRKPQQERSIEKKNRIIKAGYDLFAETGYYGTNTVEIAKRAGVSTGIVYGYFADKRDILICALEIYIDKVSTPILKLIENHSNTDLTELAESVIDKTIEMHRDNANMHKTLHALAASDEEVNAQFMILESNITQQVSQQLASLGVKNVDIVEKTHLAMNLVQSFAHEFVFDKHDYIDYPKMRQLVCNTLVALYK